MSPNPGCLKPTIPDLFKRACLCIFLLTSNNFLFSQTTNISGIVNTYHKVNNIVTAKACLIVADPTGLNVNSLVMVVQMKGATINTSNSASFGDTSSLNGAGHYEIGTICYIVGDSVFLFQKLLNTYDINSKVQLVQFGQYLSANVTDTVKAMSWDSVSGLGGVIAIYADLDLTLNAPIYADSSGYAGGTQFNYTGGCPVGTGFVYDASATGQLEGAYKGESVANISTSQDGAKGAPANGGGGGNNHNNSGGGGANLTVGGNGGGNGSTGPFTCIFGAGTNYGRAGKALSSWGGKKIFMGGGGGAGHSNNGIPTTNYGGKGGGLIFIWCDDLIGNNKLISANGGTGGASVSDGAGGGGAGGTIIMHSGNYIGNVTISANGGAGGQSNDNGNPGRCFGGGGGGSGGVIYFTGSTPAITYNVNAGAGGIEFGGSGCGTLIPSAPGTAGVVSSNYAFSRSLDPALYCLFLLPSKLIYFNGQSNDHSVLLNWKLDHPEFAEKFIVEKRNERNEWNTIITLPANDNSFHYAAQDISPVNGNNFYRLKVIEKNGSFYYSETRRIWFSHSKNDLTIYPNPSRGEVYINGDLKNGQRIQVIDINGRIAWEQIVQNNRQELLVPHLAPGVYFIRHEGLARKLIMQ